jgi:hypothetical protein
MSVGVWSEEGFSETDLRFSIANLQLNGDGNGKIANCKSQIENASRWRRGDLKFPVDYVPARDMMRLG